MADTPSAPPPRLAGRTTGPRPAGSDHDHDFGGHTRGGPPALPGGRAAVGLVATTCALVLTLGAAAGVALLLTVGGGARHPVADWLEFLGAWGYLLGTPLCTGTALAAGRRRGLNAALLVPWALLAAFLLLAPGGTM